MNNREYKKWRPFNSVVSARELISNNEKVPTPSLSKDEITEYEELLKESLYLKNNLTIIYLEKGTTKEITDFVIKLDPIKKNIVLSTKTINFRQILKISAN